MTAEAGAPPRPAHAVATGPTTAGVVARGVVYLALFAAILLPMRDLDASDVFALAAIYAIVGISLNILVGYTGQLSLGHQGFLGVGSITAANLVTAKKLPFPVGVAGGVVAGVVVALILGVVALRIRGLYLALITLVFGLAVASSLFQLGSLTNNGAGLPANRVGWLAAPSHFYLLCLGILVLVIYVDVRLTRSKTGRALLALKENERAAAAFGINVTSYKLIAFALSGAIAGLAGGLYVFQTQQFSSQNFQGQTGLNLALIFVVMVVVGGLGDRVGVIAASVFFALINKILDFLFSHGQSWLQHVPVLKAYYQAESKGALAALIGAILLLQTLIFNPGGIGQVLGPVRRWLGGRPFSMHDPDTDSGPAAVEGSSVRA
jgi:branched-chain amino acid transport system permease protein